MEQVIEKEMKPQESRMEMILDFAVLLGERIQVRGGELWRTQEMLQCIFDAYGVEDAQIFILPHLLLVSIRNGGKSQLTRQKVIEDTDVNLEELTRLNRLVRRVCAERPAPGILMELLKDATRGAQYSFHQVMGGMVLALLMLVYLFGGGWSEAAVSVVGIVLIMALQKLLSSRINGMNKLVSNAFGTFLVGLMSLFLAGFFTLDPYLVMIVVAFGLMPGIPLINSFRELLCGNVMTGSLLLLQVFMETASIVAGYFIAINLIG